MDKVEEVIVYSNKQEALLVEFIRRCLNHELTIEYQKRLIEALEGQLGPVQAENDTLKQLISDQQNQIRALETHLTTLSAPKKRKTKVQNAEPNPA